MNHIHPMKNETETSNKNSK